MTGNPIPHRIGTDMPDHVGANVIALITELEREAHAAGLVTTIGNADDHSDVPGWMLAALHPALLIAAGDGMKLAILHHRGRINAVEVHGDTYTGNYPPPVEATADGIASIASTARNWILDHTSNGDQL